VTEPSSAPAGRDPAASRWKDNDGAGFIRALAGGNWDAPHAVLLGYRIVDAQPGRVSLEWDVPDHLLNPAGIAHGGFLVALLDDAAGLAVASNYARFVPQLTVQLHTDFLRPVAPGVTHRIDGELVRAGRSTSLADARITGPDGQLLTRSTGVFQPNRRLIPRDMWSDLGL
jgi:uncharacterized protein (TIGR00369 family)